MTQKLQVDKWLFSATVGLALFGVVMVYSASAVIAVQENHNQFHYVLKQGVWTLIGFGAMFLMMRFDYQLLNRGWIVYGLLLVTILLLLAVFAFPAVNGARRWIKVSGFSAQPSELAKLSLAMFIAYFVERRAGHEQSFWKTFLPCMFALGIIAGLVVKEPDLGTALMLAIIAFTMCFAGGVRPRHMVYATVPALLFVGKMLIFTPFRMKRLTAFVDPWADAQGTGYQVVQSLIAVGSGGQHGLGFAQGRQKLLFLPFAHSDFIFAVIGEELGLIGALIVIFVFAVFLWRGMRTALRAPDRFGMLLGVGIVVGIVAQALLNMSVVLALLPTKGIPLPFISYGGSSLVPTLAGVGILLNISQYATLGRRTAYDDDDYEEDWQPARRASKKRPVRQSRRVGMARARYG
ncbi:MAG TPA: putative lipid II flippase FtsW [Pyrinomonadaceae bacterium]|jgi:cell division protein FtsW|nr:putative lipid II flippase FtsW [Pyrinomonadaceae bacterium]